MDFSDSYLPSRMRLIVGCLRRGGSWFKLPFHLFFFFDIQQFPFDVIYSSLLFQEYREERKQS